MLKSEVHTTSTPLHRAFSCYVLDANDRLLLTRRALGKATWPGVWSNTVCGHPGPGESDLEAVSRRLAQELGAVIPAGSEPEVVLPTFTYRATDLSGMVEHEFCPVHVIRLPSGSGEQGEGPLRLDPDPAEVAQAVWCPFAQVRSAVAATPFVFSPWMVEQLRQWPQQTVAGL